jgi:hypothetical protein
MSFTWFNAVLFILDGQEVPIDTTANPFIYNDNGRATPMPAPRGTLIQVSPDDPSLRLGQQYSNIKSSLEQMGQGQWAYDLVEFDFGVSQVVYQPMWATKENTPAFGMTLLHSGESIAFQYDGIVTCQYEYGAFAAYQSPYITNSHDLLPINATDLEYHAFPHFFCSQDSLPLVTTVARWRPSERAIWLADLWVQPGDCLFVPPKVTRTDYIDMHGNRNSAHACFGSAEKLSLTTQTILGNDQVFSGYATKPHYHEEKHPTVHTTPPPLVNA